MLYEINAILKHSPDGAPALGWRSDSNWRTNHFHAAGQAVELLIAAAFVERDGWKNDSNWRTDSDQ